MEQARQRRVETEATRSLDREAKTPSATATTPTGLGGNELMACISRVPWNSSCLEAIDQNWNAFDIVPPPMTAVRPSTTDKIPAVSA